MSQDSQPVSESHTVRRRTKSKNGHPSTLEEHLSEADDNEHISEDIVDLKASTRTELPAEQQPVESSEDDEPPEHFSLMDAKKQVLIEEEQKKQHLANVRKGIKRQRQQRNDKYKQQKEEKHFTKLPDDILAQVSLKETLRKKRKGLPVKTVKRKKTCATQLDQTSGDQRITLNETAVPSTASYDTAVEFLRNSCYGSRHGRESAQLMEGRRYKYAAPPCFTTTH
ncbi:uncharacterized protein [Dysidea avara]